MIRKTENCLYCGEKMESITAKKKFCSDKCKVYYNREKKRGTLYLPHVGNETLNGNAIITERKQHNHSLTLTISQKIEKQIADIQAEVKPSLISKEKFEKWKQKRISELQNQLK